MKFFSWQLPMNFKSVKELKILVIEAGSERNNTIFFFSNGTFHFYCFLILGIFFVLGIFFSILPRSYLLAIKMVLQKWDSILVAITTPTWPYHLLLLPHCFPDSVFSSSFLSLCSSVLKTTVSCFWQERAHNRTPFVLSFPLNQAPTPSASFRPSTLLKCYSYTIPC